MDTELEAVEKLDQVATAVADWQKRHDGELRGVRDDLRALEVRLGRPELGEQHGAGGAERKALAAFAREGAPIETKLNAVALGNEAGGYAVLPETSRELMKRAFEVSPMARLSRVVSIGSGGSWEEIRDIGDYGAGWVAEDDTRSATTGATFAKTVIPLAEIYASVRVSQRLLDDSMFDVANHITERIGEKFGRAIGKALVVGAGGDEPSGLVTYSSNTSSDGARTFGHLEHVKTGSNAGFLASTSSVSPADCLVDTMHALKTEFRQAAVWMMNRRTAAVVRKFRDIEGRYLWTDGIAAGQPATLLGHPVELVEDMPDVTSASVPIAFGDIRSAYAFVTRPGLKMLRDPYTDKPTVLLFCYARAGGGLIDSEAVKLVKVAE